MLGYLSVGEHCTLGARGLPIGELQVGGSAMTRIVLLLQFSKVTFIILDLFY